MCECFMFHVFDLQVEVQSVLISQSSLVLLAKLGSLAVLGPVLLFILRCCLCTSNRPFLWFDIFRRAYSWAVQQQDTAYLGSQASVSSSLSFCFMCNGIC